MKRSLNPHEVRMVAGMLDDPKYDGDEDPANLARDIVRAINERREREKLWVVGVQGSVATLHGPYLTRTAALKGRQEALTGHSAGQVGVFPLLSGLSEVEPPEDVVMFGVSV